MLVVGLTGGIACGKSSVTSMFAELGCFIIDADLISRKLVERDQPAYRRIVKFFGPSILNSDKTLARKKLGEIIFADPEKRKALNSILHPLIIREEERMVREEKGKHEITIVSAALMIESGTYKRFEKLIVVYCSHEIQIQRLMKREKIPRKEALQRISTQISTPMKKKYADYLINTSGPFSDTRRQVVRVYDKLRRLAEARSKSKHRN
jgi:dephospho-CoA kinase